MRQKSPILEGIGSTRSSKCCSQIADQLLSFELADCQNLYPKISDSLWKSCILKYSMIDVPRCRDSIEWHFWDQFSPECSECALWYAQQWKCCLNLCHSLKVIIMDDKLMWRFHSSLVNEIVWNNYYWSVCVSSVFPKSFEKLMV